MSHHFIRFTDVHYKYPSGYEALKGVTFNITHGEKVAMLGLNGAGKSTLIQLTDGLILPSSGEINIGDVPVSKKTLQNIRRAVGLIFQNPDDQLFMPTVEDDVAFGPRNMGLPENEVERRVVRALTAVGSLELRKRSEFQLSGGQKRSVAIATVLSMEPDILVMDEPTSNLDITARRKVKEIIKGFSHTVLLATHDFDLAEEVCPRMLLMSDGKIIADGKTGEIIRNTELLASAGLYV